MSKNIPPTTGILCCFLFIYLNLERIKKHQEERWQQRLSLSHLCVFKLRRRKLIFSNLQCSKISTIKNCKSTELYNPTYYAVHFPSIQKACENVSNKTENTQEGLFISMIAQRKEEGRTNSKMQGHRRWHRMSGEREGSSLSSSSSIFTYTLICN